jgi:hypothetical protein
MKTRTLADAKSEPVFGDAKGEMTFPVSLTAADSFGRVFLSIKLEQPHPTAADEGQAPS